MIGTGYARRMARYNRWQNETIYGATDGLTAQDRQRDRGAHFGSIEATLTHLLWGDRVWMNRFADTPPPNRGSIRGSVDEVVGWKALCEARMTLDTVITEWAAGLTDEALAGSISWYSNVLGRDVRRPLWQLVMHFFNHQTHHRGQVHAMLTAAGARPGDTDLFVMPEIGD